MFRILLGLGVGYFYGTKAGRKRYHQIKRGIEITTNSPVTRRLVRATRSAVAKRLDPERPNTKVVKYDPNIIDQ
ncbi:MAG: hypothetical protein Q3962_05670 [Corynebacterium sp.]|nr:hypothetical protein [Corynebacterium sp.]